MKHTMKMLFKNSPRTHSSDKRYRVLPVPPSLLQFNFDLLRLNIFIYSNFKSVLSFHVPILHHKHMNYSTPGIHCSRIKLSEDFSNFLLLVKKALNCLNGQ